MGGVIFRRPVFPSRVSRRCSVRRTLLGSCLLGLGAVSSAAAQDTVLFGLKLPPGYLNRFDRIEVLASNTGGTGVRFLPMPISTDLRLTLVKTPTALEYGIGTQIGNLGVQVGVFDGVPRAEMNQWLASGFQWNGLVQGNGALSRFALGYTHSENAGRFRLFNALGLAQQAGVSAPYSHSEVSGVAPRSFGKINTAVGMTGRLYTFPNELSAQASFDLSLSANYSPVPGMLLETSYLERQAAGSTPIPDFGLGRYRQSTLNITYRLPGADSAFRLGAVRSRVVRNWTGKYTHVHGDVFLSSSALPSMLGPSVGYQWGPDGKDRHWLISLVSLPK